MCCLFVLLSVGGYSKKGVLLSSWWVVLVIL